MAKRVRRPDTQDVHIKLTVTVWSKIRVLLFQKDLFFQEILQEFAQRVVDNDMYAMKIIDDLVQRKISAKIQKKKKRLKKQKTKDKVASKTFKVDENDSDMLYKLIQASVDQNDSQKR